MVIDAVGRVSPNDVGSIEPHFCTHSLFSCNIFAIRGPFGMINNQEGTKRTLNLRASHG